MKVTYNGYTFNDKSHINIDTEVVYDEAGRVAIKKMLTITVKSIITPTRNEEGAFSTGNPPAGSTPVNNPEDRAKPAECLNNDYTHDNIREKLCEIGAVLDVSGIGFGKLRVNDYNADDPDFAVVDMAHGPKPRVIRWTPIAGAGAAEIVWTVVTVVPPCKREDDLKSMNFNVGFSVNEKGYTTRRVSGFLEVINSDVSPGFRRSADDFRDRIVVAKITNSLRTQNFDLSADRSRLDFSIVDTEIESPNSYPPDVVSISAPLTLRIPKPHKGSVHSVSRLNVNLELTATASRIRAWEIFTAVFRDRTRDYPAARVIVQELTITEDPFTNQYRFAVSWIVTMSFEQLLLSSGLFKAFGLDWSLWSQSVNQVQANRGLGQFKYSEAGQDDKLVTACDDELNNTVIVATEAVPYFSNVSTYTILCNENPPPPEASYEKFHAYLVNHDRYNDTLITTYGEASLRQNGFDINSTDNETESHEVTKGNEIDETLARGVPTHGWIWRGHARRIGIGNKIPKPGLRTIGGIAVEVTGEPMIVSNRIDGYYMCQPIYESIWSIGYVAKTQATPLDEDSDPSTVNNDSTPDDIPSTTGP